MELRQIRKDLEFLQHHDVVIHGSFISNQMTPRSDIDIAIITRQHDLSVNNQVNLDVIGRANSRYDIRVFEILPLHIQINIIKHHMVLFGDEIDLSEYFYFYRKLWDDVKQRIAENQFQNSKELKETILIAKKRRMALPLVTRN